MILFLELTIIALKVRSHPAKEKAKISLDVCRLFINLLYCSLSFSHSLPLLLSVNSPLHNSFIAVNSVRGGNLLETTFNRAMLIHNYHITITN